MLTNEYKELLLKYITGKINESGSSPQALVGLDRKDITNNIKDNITNMLRQENNATNVVILGKIYSNQYSNFMIYGNYETSSNQYGYMCIVDSNLNIIDMLTRYDSGTLIYPLVSVRQSETGQFYGLTYGTNGNDTDYRIALFNNVLSSGILDNNYSVVLRQTYIVPNSASYRGALYRQNRITKSLDSATYYIVLHNTNNVSVVVKFTISVGEGNKWEVFEMDYLIDSVQFDVLLDKSSGDEIFYLYGIDVINSPSVYRAYQVQDIITPIDTVNFSYDVSAFLSQVFVMNKDTIYISAGNLSTHKTTVYKVANSSLSSIYDFTWNSSSNQSYLYLENVNEIIFFKQKNAGSSSSTISIGLLENNTIVEYDNEQTNDVSNANYDYNDFYIFVQYNLVSIYIPYKLSSNGTYIFVADYSIYNYNGLPYENINSLLPTKARILSRDDNSSNPTLSYVFARNLYNKYIKDNTTISTLEVPNTLLNNQPLFYVGLLGATNYYLASNVATIEGTDIVKNIYETLDFNFYNTLTMVDNNASQSIENKQGASKVNQSINASLDYHDIQATKARINFTDNTYNIITIDPSTQITINGNTANYDFVIYVPSNKNVSNVEIISYDETMVYATITGTFTLGAFNEVLQKVSIV